MKLCNNMLLVLLLLMYCSEVQSAREREPLEAFNLNNLKVVKIYPSEHCGPSAGVRDPNNYLHRIFVGDYIGKYFGLVSKITNEGVFIKEVFKARDGKWKEREVLLKVILEFGYPSKRCCRPGHGPTP